MPLNFPGIYLLQTYSCIITNNTVYKIGMSNNLYRRLQDYPNGSLVYLAIECHNTKQHETNLINIFKTKFTNKPFYGTEYFEGDKTLMISTIID